MLRAPSDRFRSWQSGQGSGMRVAAALVVDKPRDKAREQDLAMLPAKPAAYAGAAPRTGVAAQEQLGEQERHGDSRLAKAATPRAEDAPITQADLKRFVDETLQKERALAAGAPGLPAADRGAGEAGPAGLSSYSKAGLAHHPTWYDTHTGWGGSWHQNHWCYDNPQWHGPFGDPCVAYATGGDRQFWCEWDGAGADNACPRSCGTCSWRSYYKDEASHERKEHLLHEHFDPQEAPPEALGQEQAQSKASASSKESGKGGPLEPMRVAQRRSRTGALLKQVLEMKHRLLEVAKATRAVATEVALSRTNNHHLSSGQAAADLANFFQDKKTMGTHKSGESDSSAIQDLISFFDHEPGGKAAGKGTQLSSLREKVSAGTKGTKGAKKGHAEADNLADVSSSPQIVADLTRQQKEQMAQKARAAKKAAAAHRLSSDAATKDIQNYWGTFQAKTQAAATERGHRGMTAQAANKDLDLFLSQMVANARVAHRATEAAEKARRAKTHGGKEAVPAKHLSDKQAREEFAHWWVKDMVSSSKSASSTSPPADKHSKGVKKPSASAAQSGAKTRKSKGLAVFSAEAAAKELESFWNEEFPTPHRQDRREGERRRGQRDRRNEWREEGERREEGGASQSSDLGVPHGRDEAVRISHAHRTTSDASRGDMDDYFGKMLRKDNIAAAKQRLKEHAVQPAMQSPAQVQAPVPSAQYAYAGYPAPQYPAPNYAINQELGAVPVMRPLPRGDMQHPQVEWQQMVVQPGAAQLPAAKWPQTSLLNPMQAAFGAAYDG